MSIAQQKLKLSQKILDVKGPAVLKRIEHILDEELATSWDELPSNIKSDILQSISELDSGKMISNEEVLARAHKLYLREGHY